MNKAELINRVAARTELNKKDINHSITAALEVIMEAVSEGRKVVFLGFGSFEPRVRGPRKSMNPKTREPIEVPEKRVPGFVAGKTFKECVAY